MNILVEITTVKMTKRQQIIKIVSDDFSHHSFYENLKPVDNLFMFNRF